MTLESALAVLSIMTVIGGGILGAIWVEVRAIRKSLGGLTGRVIRLETLAKVSA